MQVGIDLLESCFMEKESFTEKWIRDEYLQLVC
jgi:hypothetical protein